MTTTFKACVQKRRKDGFWPVYIRVIHNKKVAYIPTGKMLTDAQLTKHQEITDPFVMEHCMKHIIKYMDALNRKNTEQWTVREVVEFLENGDYDICFSD